MVINGGDAQLDRLTGGQEVRNFQGDILAIQAAEPRRKAEVCRRLMTTGGAWSGRKGQRLHQRSTEVVVTALPFGAIPAALTPQVRRTGFGGKPQLAARPEVAANSLPMKRFTLLIQTGCSGGTVLRGSTRLGDVILATIEAAGSPAGSCPRDHK